MQRTGLLQGRHGSLAGAMLRLSFSTTQQPYGGSILAELDIGVTELDQANDQQCNRHAGHTQEVGPVHAEENQGFHTSGRWKVT